MWGTFLSEPLLIVAPVGRYPAGKLIRRIPILYRPKPLVMKICINMTTYGINPPFDGLSHSKGQVGYALLTRAPVAISTIASGMLPLDLHVLSLSLAFILSQDQTLHCK